MHAHSRVAIAIHEKLNINLRAKRAPKAVWFVCTCEANDRDSEIERDILGHRMVKCFFVDENRDSFSFLTCSSSKQSVDKTLIGIDL